MSDSLDQADAEATPRRYGQRRQERHRSGSPWKILLGLLLTGGAIALYCAPLTLTAGLPHIARDLGLALCCFAGATLLVLGLRR